MVGWVLRVYCFDSYVPTAAAAFIESPALLAVKNYWDLSHFDVEQAFIQTEGDGGICIQLRSVYDKVVALNKCLYVLEQAPWPWYYLMLGTLQDYMIEQCLVGLCVLKLGNDGG